MEDVVRVPDSHCSNCHHTVGVHGVTGCSFDCDCKAVRVGPDHLRLRYNPDGSTAGKCGHVENAVCENAEREAALRVCTECDHKVKKHGVNGCLTCQAEKPATQRCGINVFQFPKMTSLSRPGRQVPWVEPPKVEGASCANPDRVQVTGPDYGADQCKAEYHGDSGDYRCTYFEHPNGLVHGAPDQHNPELTFHWAEQAAVYPLPAPVPGPIKSSGGPSVRDRQVGGTHYLGAIQPWDIWEAFDLNPWQANAIKYILRAGNKPGVTAKEDFSKAIHFLEYLVEREDRGE